MGRTLLIVGVLGCASAPPPPAEPPEYVDGVRQRPLEVAEVERALSAVSPRLTNCYKRVRLSLGLEAPSDYVVRLRVENAGEPPLAEVVKASKKGQEQLERCLVQELEALRFPAHVGSALVVDVPIDAPKR